KLWVRGITVFPQHRLEHHIHRKPWDAAKHEVEWGKSGRFVNSAVVHKGQSVQHLGPRLFLSGREHPDHVTEGTVKPLDKDNAHTVVGSRVGFSHTRDLEECGDQITLKVCTLVRVNALRKAIEAEKHVQIGRQ